MDALFIDDSWSARPQVEMCIDVTSEAICWENIHLKVVFPHATTEYEQKQSYTYAILSSFH